MKHTTEKKIIGNPGVSTLVLNPERERINSKQVMRILLCLTRDDQPKKITLTWKSCDITGMRDGKVDVTASGYNFTFSVLSGQVVSCVSCLTPSGKEYHYLTDREGNGGPYPMLSKEDRDIIHTILTAGEEEMKIGVVVAYKVVMDPGGPKESGIRHAFDKGVGKTGKSFPHELQGGPYFYTREEAEAVAKKYETYRRDLLDKSKK